VRACLDLWERRAPFGKYHVVNPGPLTPRKIMQRVRRLFRPERHEGLLDGRFYASMDEAVLPRPAGCVLDIAKLESSGVRMRSAVKALEDSIRKWRPDLKVAVRSSWSMRPKPTNEWGHWLPGTVTPE
jgi:dTDP-4-dehydrorhamnose 3,5-epimerase